MNEPLTSLRSIDTKYLGAFAILLAAVTFVYWPGLVGPFLFDDFGSISELGALGGVSDWQTFKAFIFGGFTGPTGRPVALLSFLIDGNNWPTEPLPFKRTNLVIHLLNGVLLGILTLQILKLTDVQSQHAKWLALLSAGCWLLHPFLVSTTLYVVQRMAQLATTFVFLGLITYLHGRGKLTANRVSAYVIMSLGAGRIYDARRAIERKRRSFAVACRRSRNHRARAGRHSFAEPLLGSHFYSGTDTVYCGLPRIAGVPR